MKENFVFHSEPIGYYTSPLLDFHKIRHCFTTRLGGISPAPFDTLNLACGAGDIRDSAENVYENHDRCARLFGLTAAEVVRTYQIHSAEVRTVTEADRGTGLTKPPFDGADGLATDRTDVVLSVRSADCVPVVLADSRTGAVAAVHSGWRGTVGGIAVHAVLALEKLGSRRQDLLVAVGPCIQRCCYEVGAELYDNFTAVNPALSVAFTPRGEKYMLSLPDAITHSLLAIGLTDKQISVCTFCTCCDKTHFFSHRRQGVNRGTMGAFIVRTGGTIDSKKGMD